MIFIKIFISVIVISLLIFISERNPKIGGFLSGLPIGTGIIIFFNGIEQGSKFVIEGLPFGILGLLSSLFFTIGFYIGGKFFIHNSHINTLLALTFGVSFFLIISYVITFFQASILTSSILFLIGVIDSTVFFKSIKNDVDIKPMKTSFTSIVFRILFVTLIIITITGISKSVGSSWAGILSSFPSVLTPVLMVLCYLYQDKIYPTVIKNFSFGITTLLVFYITISYTFLNFGVYKGILLAYIVCFAYLFALNKTINRIKK